MSKIFKIKSRVWLYPGIAGWHFVGIPRKESEKIEGLQKLKKGFGSVPVAATVGKTTWNTSIFPDKKSGTYLLPIKVEVRKKENIFSGDEITVTLKIN